MSKENWQPSPYIVLAVGVSAASTASLFIRYAQGYQTPSLVIAALRLTLASLILTPFALRSYRPELRRLARHDLGLALLSGALLAVHFASWITSLEYVSVLVSVVLVSTGPLWVAIFAPILLHELLDRRILAGIVIAFAGGVLVSLSGSAGFAGTGGNPALGSILAVTGAITVALYLIIGRRLRASLSLIPYVWLVYGTAAVVLLIATFASHDTLLGYDPKVYFWMLMLAVFPQLIGHSSFNYALAHIPTAYVSLVTLGEPVGSTLLAFIFLGETPAWLQIAGACLILFAVVFAQRQRQPTQESSVSEM